MLNDKKVLAVTLARGGSLRIPKKNIALVNGRPLIEYTFDEVKKSKYIDKYITSTEDSDIAKVCADNGVEVHDRPASLASATSTSAESLIDVVENNMGFHYVVEIMCTNPLKTVYDIDGVLEKLDRTRADSVVSVVRIWDHHPSRVKYIEADLLMNFYPEVPESRRQDLTPPAYVRNGSIYATTVSSLLGNGVRLGPITHPYIMPEERSINIDEPIDILLADILIKRGNKCQD